MENATSPAKEVRSLNAEGVIAALRQARGNPGVAAINLGISREEFVAKVEWFGIGWSVRLGWHSMPVPHSDEKVDISESEKRARQELAGALRDRYPEDRILGDLKIITKHGFLDKLAELAKYHAELEESRRRLDCILLNSG